MQKELELWQFAAEKLKQNKSVMLLVVAESAGSSPGRQGFKMIVAEDEMCGSIGGGVMEVRLVEQAKEILSAPLADGFNQNILKPQVHQKNSPQSSGMICSGKQTVIFFKLVPEHFKLVRKIPHYLEKRNRHARYLQITQNEIKLPGRFKPQPHFKFEQKDENEFIYEEKITGYKNKLFIVGGGHCALALSELMAKMDFHISLFDDRADLNTLEKNKFVHRKQIIESYDTIDEHIPSGIYNFVVVMTLGYKSDETVIKKLLDKNFKYFGVLGSKAKMKTLLRNLEKEGFPKERLDKIHTPIGLPIISRTPEEIAISIAAEIIAVKNSNK